MGQAKKILGNPDRVWGPEKLLIRCSKESQHPAEWTPGPLVEHQENEKDTMLTAIRVGVRILQFMFGLQLPLTHKPWITFSNPCNKVRRKYFVKEVFLRLSLLLCRYDADYEYITLPWLKIPVYPTFYPKLIGGQVGPCLSERH